MDGVERSMYLIDEVAIRHSIDVPRVETCDMIDEPLKPLLEGLEALIPPGARLEGGDLVIDTSSAEMVGFLAEPDRVLLRFDGFDVVIPDATAHDLLRQLTAKLS